MLIPMLFSPLVMGLGQLVIIALIVVLLYLPYKLLKDLINRR